MITVLDFEGTSRLATARATEIGIVQLDINLKARSEFESLIKPPVKADSFALKVSKLSSNELSNAPTFASVWPSLHPFLSGSILVAHNKIYEINVLENEFADLNIKDLPPFICTLEWSRRILGTKVQNHQLQTICKYLNVPLENAHEALSDARATSLVLIELANKSKALNDEIKYFSTRTVAYAQPKKLNSEPVLRERIIISQSDEIQLEEAKTRFRRLGYTTVVITGVPALGKDGFGKELSKVGLVYKETAPGQKTAFVIKSDHEPGASKIRKAKELGVPVLSESDALKLLERLRVR